MSSNSRISSAPTARGPISVSHKVLLQSHAFSEEAELHGEPYLSVNKRKCVIPEIVKVLDFPAKIRKYSVRGLSRITFAAA